MAELTIDDVLKGHTIEQNTMLPKARWRGWFLDEHPQPFPHKVYAAIVAVALAEANETISFPDLKAYALRVVAAEGSEDYFRGERGFNPERTTERTDFSVEVSKMKMLVASSSLSVAELEVLIRSELRQVENAGGLQLRMLAMSINDIARHAISYVKKREGVPYLKPLKDANEPRALFYSLIR